MAKAPKIGVVLGLDGESEFRKSISDVNKSMSLLASEMKKASSEFIDNKDSVEGLTAKNDVLNKKVDEQKKAVNALRDALEQSKKQYGDNADTTQEWQKSLNYAEADLNKLNRELAENYQALDKAQNPIDRTGKGIKQIGTHAETAGKQCFTMGDMIKANLISEAIIGGVRALGSAIVAVASEMAEFIADGVQNASDLAESQNVVDVTFGNSAAAINDWSKKAASAYGLSELEAKKYSGTMGAMLKSMGLSEDEVVSMSTSMSGLAADFSSFYNLEHDDAFAKIRSGISGETEPLKQLGINMSVANLEAYAMSEGMKTAYKDMSQSEQTLLRYNYLMQVSADAQGDFANTSDSFANQQKIAKLNIDNLATSIGSTLLPVLNEGLQVFNGMFDGSVSLSDGMNQLTEKVIGLAGQLVAKIPELAAIGGQIITTVITAIGENLPQLMTAGGSILTALSTAISTNAPTILSAGKTILGTLWTSFNDNIGTIIEMGLNFVMNLVSGISGNIGSIANSGIDILLTLINGISSKLPELIPMVSTIITDIIKAVWDHMPEILEAGANLLVNLIQGLLNSIPILWSMLPEAIDAIINVFEETDWGEIGKNILDGIGAGISNAVKGVTKAAKDAVSSVVGGVKEFLGIKSPSRLMRDTVGKYMAEGIGVGFSDEMKNVSANMTNAIPASFDTSLNVNGNYNSGTGQAAGRKQIFNISNLNVLDKGDQNRTLSQLEFLAMI